MGDVGDNGADVCGLVHTSTGLALLDGLDALLPPQHSVAYATPQKGRTP